MGKDLHLHYGSAVMLPMMRMLSLFLFSHKVFHAIMSLVHVYLCQHPVICTGFHLANLPINSWVLIYAGQGCMFLDLMFIMIKIRVVI